MIASCLSLVQSVVSSIITEKKAVLSNSTNWLCSTKEKLCRKIFVANCLPRVTPARAWSFGNNFLRRGIKLSARRNGRLCSAENMQMRCSISLELLPTVRSFSMLPRPTFVSISLLAFICYLVRACRVNSDFPQYSYFKQNLQYGT